MNEHPMTATEALERERQWIAEQEANPVTIPAFLVPLMVKALEQAEDALDTLRRGHGVSVSERCYPALNTVREALDLLDKDQPALPRSDAE